MQLYFAPKKHVVILEERIIPVGSRTLGVGLFVGLQNTNHPIS